MFLYVAVQIKVKDKNVVAFDLPHKYHQTKIFNVGDRFVDEFGEEYIALEICWGSGGFTQRMASYSFATDKPVTGKKLRPVSNFQFVDWKEVLGKKCEYVFSTLAYNEQLGIDRTAENSNIGQILLPRMRIDLDWNEVDQYLVRMCKGMFGYERSEVFSFKAVTPEAVVNGVKEMVDVYGE